MPDWLEYLLRVLLAIGLGFAIGLERKMRFKEAGIRTHVVVSAGACLFMLVSKYGFGDSTQFDASRIASTVVTGIGFIGAGMIIYRKQAVHGLTTAAGVWFTAGVGCAAGAGMYIVSAGATVLIIIVQCILHLRCWPFKAKHYSQVKIVYKNGDDSNGKVKELFGINEFGEINATREGEHIVFTTIIRTDKTYSDDFILQTLKENSFILSIERIYDDI